MADATPAPREPNRSRPERPEVALARAMVATEYGLSAAHRARAEGPTLAERLMERVRDGWAVVMEALGVSRSRRVGQPPPAPGRMAAGLPGGPPQWGPAAAPVPSAPARWAPPAGPEEAAFREMGRLQALAKQLSPRRYEAFEDAVLHLVRTDGRLGKVYEKSPETIPAIARYVANAQTRELLREGDGDRAGAERTDPEVRAARERTARERFERPAPPPVPAQEQQGQQEQRQEVPPEPPEESRLRDVDDGQGRSYDAHAFAAAEEAERAKREEAPGREVPAATDESRLWSVGGEPAYEALPFAVAAEEQRAWREQSSERDDRERRDGRETPAPPSDPQRPASPEPVSPLSPVSPLGSPGLGLPAGTGRPAGPVSPVVAEPPRALLGDRGLRAARDGFESRDGRPPRRTADSPSAATVHRPAPARTAKGPTR
ncbi:hypothetical protein [Streptomyces shenzhenensis]|uniref:hypothetical protein n=1 Tax=Streptomyces shenzhenensis TaxID=943815 RepID=UPI0033C56047